MPPEFILSSPIHIEDAGTAIASKIQTQDNPTGTPLHDLLATLQKEVPTIQGIHLSGDRLLVSHETPPSDTDRARITEILSNPSVPNAAPVAENNHSVPSLKDLLRNPATPDHEWIRAFRSYAVQVLIQE